MLAAHRLERIIRDAIRAEAIKKREWIEGMCEGLVSHEDIEAKVVVQECSRAIWIRVIIDG